MLTLFCYYHVVLLTLMLLLSLSFTVIHVGVINVIITILNSVHLKNDLNIAFIFLLFIFIDLNIFLINYDNNNNNNSLFDQSVSETKS